MFSLGVHCQKEQSNSLVWYIASEHLLFDVPSLKPLSGLQRVQQIMLLYAAGGPRNLTNVNERVN